MEKLNTRTTTDSQKSVVFVFLKLKAHKQHQIHLFTSSTPQNLFRNSTHHSLITLKSPI